MARAAAQAVQHAPGAVHSVGATRGTQREYETVLILKPSFGKSDILGLVERMQKVFAERGARLLRIDNWGTRILAFPIKSNRKGIYLYWRYLGGSDLVPEFERILRNHEAVLRHYTVRIDEDVDPEARPSEVTEELLDAASDSGPDPDEERARIEAERAAAEAAEREAAEREAAAAAAAESSAAETAEEGESA